MDAYTTEDIIRLEARICALESYIREHDKEGSWFLDQEFHKWLTVVAARHTDYETFEKFRQERLAHEERCHKEGIDLKFP